MLELKYIITNGYVSMNTLSDNMDDGWNYVCTVPAYYSLSTAMPNDKLTIFSRMV